MKTNQTQKPGGESPRLVNSALALRDCYVSYGRVPALRGVSLRVEEGEMVALLGANGAGKSTCLRSISGLVHVSRGEIEFSGIRLDKMSAHRIVGEGVSQVPEGRDLFPGLTVEENLRFGHWPRRRERHSFSNQRDNVFEQFPKLAERRGQLGGSLSGGEQQMLAIGMALMPRPKLLLVDELSLGLAPVVVSELFEALLGINRAGTSVLLVEQFIPLALANTHRAYVLSKGEIVLERLSSELRQSPELLSSYLGSTAAGEANA